MDRLRTIAAFICCILASQVWTSCEELENYLDWGQNDGQDSGTTETPDVPVEPKDEFVILFTNDFHSQIEPLSQDETYNAGRGGIKRIKVLVDSVRAAEPAVLLADAGDLVQGTYYFSLLNGVVEMKILDELGYDVRTLGNHEFDKKMVGLGEMLAMSKVPVVASNYDFANTSLAQRVLPSTIIETGGRKIGFIGLNVRLLNLVDPTACEGVVWQDAINVADSEAQKLIDNGAEMVIALSHLGYQKNDDRAYYDRGVALRTRNIDMIIGGHSHTFLNYPVYVTNLDGESVPVVQTGSRGVCLGYAKIKFDKQGKPSYTYRLIPVDSRLDKKVDAGFSDLIDAYSGDVSGKMNEVLGYCPVALRKYEPESPLGNLTADALIWMAKHYYGVDADVSVYNSGGIRAEISKGNITLGDVYAVYPFDNVLSIVTLKGRDLRTLFDAVASGGLPVNGAVRLVTNNGKVASVTVNGASIDDDKEYTVATIDYLVNTGRYGLDKALTRRDAPEIIRDYFGEFFKYLASQHPQKEITYSTDGRVR